MVVLFTFGSGTLGELGTGRLDDAKRVKAIAVEFPLSVPRNANGEPTLEAVALGTDHSLALIGGHVFRWGLMGANVDPRQRRDGQACQPEVVPEPTSISELVPFTCRDNAQNLDGSFSSPDGFVRSIVCGGSNSFMLNFQGELFMIGSLKSRPGNPDCLRHIWGNPRGDASCKIAKVVAGWRHCLILTEAGNVFALGDDEHGQCAGVGTGTVAVSLPKGQSIVGVAAGACHSVAWDRNGFVFSWGHGGSGRLGVGGTRNRRVPARVEMIQERVVAARCGANFTVFVTSYGQSIWACGGNQYGQLGVGGEGRAACEIPVPLGFPQNGQEVVSLECGANHVLCLTRHGEMHDRLVAWAWGCASSGQCGSCEGEGIGRALPTSRSTPGALLDFLPPSPNWPLAIAAGRSHSAILAQIGGVAVEPNLDSADFIKSPCAPNSPQPAPTNRISHRLPEVPREHDMMTDVYRLKLPSAPSNQWMFPEGGSISQIQGMNGGEATSISPLRLASHSPPTQHNPNNTALLHEDDIIDIFCAGLVGANRSPTRLPSPLPRSVSPAAELGRIGEETLCGNMETTLMTSTATQEQQSSLDIGKGKAKPVAKSNARRSVVTGAHSARRASTQNASSSTPQRCANSSWPRPPLSWSASRRRSSSQRNRSPQRRRGSRSPSPERKNSRVVTPPPPPPSSQPTSMWEAHPGPYVTGISTLSTTLDSPNLMEASPKLPPAPSYVKYDSRMPSLQAAPMVAMATSYVTQDYMALPPASPMVKRQDQGTGEYELLQDQLQSLTNLIANIGGPTLTSSSMQKPHGMGAITTGSSHPAYAFADRNATSGGYQVSGNAESAIRFGMSPSQRDLQGVALPSSPYSMPHNIVADTSAMSHHSSLGGQWTPSPQKPGKFMPSTQAVDSRYAPPLMQPLDLGSPRECGSGSDTHLDFSPRSTGSSPPQRGQGRRRLSNTPTRCRSGLEVAPQNKLPFVMVTNPSYTEAAVDRSMFVLNGASQVPLSPWSEEQLSARKEEPSPGFANLGDSIHGGEENDPIVEDDAHRAPTHLQQHEPDIPVEKISSPRVDSGSTPWLLETNGSETQMPDTYYASRPSSATSMGGLEIPPPQTLTRKVSGLSADSADGGDSVAKGFARRDSNTSSAPSSNASHLKRRKSTTSSAENIVDGLSIPTGQERDSVASVGELRTPYFGDGVRSSATTGGSSSTHEEDKTDSDSSSSGASKKSTTKLPSTMATLGSATAPVATKVGPESVDDSDSGSASSSSGSSGSGSDDDDDDDDDSVQSSKEAQKKKTSKDSEDWI